MPFIQEHPSGFVLKVFVVPKSSKNMVSGLQGDALKIKITAPPVDGAANKMCIQYLAKQLNISRSSFEILSGQTSRTKRVLVRCGELKPDKKRVRSLIEALVES